MLAGPSWRGELWIETEILRRRCGRTGVQQLSNATRSDVDKRCKAVLLELQKSFRRAEGFVAVDTTTIVHDSIVEVEKTLAEAIVI